MILGLVINSTPIEVLFLSPPLIPLIRLLPTRVSAQVVNPNCLIRFSTLLNFSSLDYINLRSAANWKHSLGVKVANNASYCITYPICLQYGSTELICYLLNLIPPSTVKLLDISLPDKKFKRVVLPDPDGPKIAVKVESWIRPSWCCKITFY